MGVLKSTEVERTDATFAGCQFAEVGQAARTKSIFAGASVATPPQNRRLAAHFPPKWSETEGRMQ